MNNRLRAIVAESFERGASRVPRFPDVDPAQLDWAEMDSVADAMEFAEGAIHDAGVGINRPGQRAAWRVVTERAVEAWRAGWGDEEAIERAEVRAHRSARITFDRLPERATIDDFATAILHREPGVGAEYAHRLAAGVVKGLSAEPVVQRAPAPAANPFIELRIAPSPRAVVRWRRALSMIGDTMASPSAPARTGNLAGLRLATFEGVPVQPVDAMQNDAPDLLAIETSLMEAGQIDLAAAVRRERLGMTKTAGPGLAFVDFDPTVSAPPPAWLARGLLPRTGIGLLFGESGAGKSFAAVHAALSIAWGLPLFGARTKRGAVLYIAAEGGKGVLRRFRAANDALAGAIAAANLARPAGSAPLHRAPIRVVHEAPDLSRDGDASPLVRTIRAAAEEFEREGERLALVIVDTWHAAMGGGDENSAADAGHALKPLIAESEAGHFLTLIVHHPGKDSDRGARGSNALPAAADAIIAITVPGHGGAVAKPSSARRKATVTKMRDGEAGGGFDYRLNIVEVGRDEDGEPVTTCTVEACDAPKVDGEGLTALDRDFMTTIAAALEGGAERAAVDEVRLKFYANRPDAKPEARRKAWQRALRAAIESERVNIDEHDTWLSFPVVE